MPEQYLSNVVQSWQARVDDEPNMDEKRRKPITDKKAREELVYFLKNAKKEVPKLTGKETVKDCQAILIKIIAEANGEKVEETKKRLLG